MSTALGCEEVRALLPDHQRGRLEPGRDARVLAHLDACAACAHEDAAERALGEVLERRLPQHAAPLGLKRRLAAQWPAPPAPSPWRARARRLAPALVLAVLVLVALPLAFTRTAVTPVAMVTEAVNDHLRVLSSQNPLDVRSGGIHQVKPWFEGRLDFAPVVPLVADPELPLEGGAVGYYLDRKAAVLVFHRRQHVVTLYVFRADGLPWPTRGLEAMGPVRAHVATSRGFTAILWHAGELGYALVSDVDPAELRRIGARIAAAG
jgi:anti-sigma factor RsiW